VIESTVMDYAYFHELCMAADEQGEMRKIEMRVGVYIQENERRIDPGHNVQVFAGTFGHASGKDHADINADTDFLDHDKINEIGV
jgi:hypothetical protein